MNELVLYFIAFSSFLYFDDCKHWNGNLFTHLQILRTVFIKCHSTPILILPRCAFLESRAF